MSNLYKAVNYLIDVPLLKSYDIYEYDIAKANISVLYNRGLISSSLYSYLYNQDNMIRKVMIGKMEKDNPNLIKEKAQGIEDAKKYIFDMNNIDDSEVISIKNDAIYITRKIEHTRFNHAEFTLRNHYNLFIKIFRLEFYYLWDNVTNFETLDIKGIRDEILESQRKYLLDFVKELFYTYMKDGTAKAIILLRSFYQTYMNKTLDIRYYKDLYSGLYSINTNSTVYNYDSSIPDDKLLPFINISNNGAILRELGKILYLDYFG